MHEAQRPRECARSRSRGIRVPDVADGHVAARRLARRAGTHSDSTASARTQCALQSCDGVLARVRGSATGHLGAMRCVPQADSSRPGTSGHSEAGRNAANETSHV